MTQHTAHAGADQRDLLATVDRPVVDVELFGNASLIKRTSQRSDHRIGVFFKEEFTVTQHPTGVIDQPDQFGLFAISAATDVRPEHRVGLPELVGVLHAEGESTLGLAGVILEQFMFTDESAEGGPRDLVGIEQSFLDAQPIDRGLGRRFVACRTALVKVGQGRVDRFEDFLGGDFSWLAFVGPRRSRKRVRECRGKTGFG